MHNEIEKTYGVSEDLDFHKATWDLFSAWFRIMHDDWTDEDIDNCAVQGDYDDFMAAVRKELTGEEV